MSPLPVIAFNAIALSAAVFDLRLYRIPNAAPTLLALSAVLLAPPGTPAELASRLGSALAVGLVAGALWLRGVIGGGDLKLLMACALWIPLAGLPGFLMALGLASAIQGTLALALARLRPGASTTAALRTRLPYAVSIAAACLVWSCRWLVDR